MLDAHRPGPNSDPNAGAECEWDEKPRDMLQWLLEEAQSKGTAFDNVVEKVLLINFGAIHTSSGVCVSSSLPLFLYLHICIAEISWRACQGR